MEGDFAGQDAKIGGLLAGILLMIEFVSKEELLFMSPHRLSNIWEHMSVYMFCIYRHDVMIDLDPYAMAMSSNALKGL